MGGSITFLLSVSEFLEILDPNIFKLKNMMNIYGKCGGTSSKNTLMISAVDKCLLQILIMSFDFFIPFNEKDNFVTYKDYK